VPARDELPMIDKNGMFAITGRPNVGKSTLINALAGEKVAIVSHKPQTTRNRITAVRNINDCQYIFLDTPGFHKPVTRLGKYMNEVVSSSVADVDAVLLVVEPEARVGKPESILIDKIKALKIPAILVINKIDTVARERILEVISAYQNVHDFEEYIPISAKLSDGIDVLFNSLSGFVVEGPPLFPEGQSTDQPDRQIAAEIIREKLLITLDKEVPHGIAVVVEVFEEKGIVLNISATIYCEKDSHKGIIIGKNGAKLKAVGSMARTDLERFFGAKVFLETWVKVKENWRQSETQIRNFGFSG
jgi:GTP-binding protein Era